MKDAAPDIKPGTKQVVSAAWLSVAIGMVVFGLKYAAYLITDSVSLYSDALESIVNIVAAAVTLYAIHVSVRPPDVNHPYGHTKAEYFSAILEGALILFAAIEIVRASWRRFIEPAALSDLDIGMAVSVGATLINGGLAMMLVWRGRSTRSPALVANGKHIWTDVFTTLGVLAGVGLAGLTGWWILDPLLAIVVAVNIVRVGIELVMESIGGLMDESLSDEQMDRVKHVIEGHMEGGSEVHALRSRRAGRHTFIEFHLVVPGAITVETSHAICDRLEGALRDTIAGSIVTIHVEPESKAKHEGRVVRLGE